MTDVRREELSGMSVGQADEWAIGTSITLCSRAEGVRAMKDKLKGAEPCGSQWCGADSQWKRGDSGTRIAH